MNFTDCKNIIKNRESKKMGNNTYLHLIPGGYALRLHQTDIIEYYPGYCILKTGGWFTNTTKDRLNKYSPVFIHTKNSIWYIGDYNDNTILYYDRIKIDYSGNIKSKIQKPAKVEKKTKAIKAKIKKYAAGCVDLVKSGDCIPSGGDCWYCCLRTEDNKTLGDASENNDHLLQHIKDGYYVPSLVVNAIKEAGYRFPEIIIGYNPETKKTGDHFLPDSINRSVIKYMQKRLLHI